MPEVTFEEFERQLEVLGIRILQQARHVEGDGMDVIWVEKDTERARELLLTAYRTERERVITQYKLQEMLQDYNVALQRAIEQHCNGEVVSDTVAAVCPHLARKLNEHLKDTQCPTSMMTPKSLTTW